MRPGPLTNDATVSPAVLSADACEGRAYSMMSREELGRVTAEVRAAAPAAAAKSAAPGAVLRARLKPSRCPLGAAGGHEPRRQKPGAGRDGPGKGTRPLCFPDTDAVGWLASFSRTLRGRPPKCDALTAARAQPPRRW